MKKFISLHRIILIAVILALIIVFLYIPFIVLSGGYADHVNPCSLNNNGTFGGLCNLNNSVSLFGYLKDREPIISIEWLTPIIFFIVFTAFFYGEIKLILSVIKFQNKKKRFGVLLVKFLAAAIIVYIPFFIISLILSFFGLSLTLQ